MNNNITEYLSNNQMLSCVASKLPERLSIFNSSPIIQVYVGLSELWRRLRDLERSFGCASRACDVGRGHNSLNLNTRHHRNALLQMAAALRAKGELGDAHDYVNVSSPVL